MERKNVTAKSRLAKLYAEKLRAQLQEALKLSNVMEVPRLVKIVINVGAKEAVSDSRVLQVIESGLIAITGQKTVRTYARKSIAGFKIREGMPLGVMVTLRGHRMYDFLDKIINLALPKTRDFQGVPNKLDGKGNYNLGIKDWSIFPETDSLQGEKSFGLNITFHTTAKTNEHGHELLKQFGMPFKKNKA